MLLAPDGRRAGTVSGGCLEAQVAGRAWWLTADGPTVQRYSTVEEDGDRPFGSGCGGIVTLLLERSATAAPLLRALQRAFDRRLPIAVATMLEGPQMGRRAFAGLPQEGRHALANGQADPAQQAMQTLADSALELKTSIEQRIGIDGSEVRVLAIYRPPRPGLWIFGAGDDAQPLLALAKDLGWFVTVADGRSHLATRDRFPRADELVPLPIHDLPALPPAAPQPPFDTVCPWDAAILLSHSFQQDARILASLLALDTPQAYLGVLGPQRRTREVLAESARLLGLPADAERIEGWLSQLHAPTGLDLGAESPETIALSIVAEIQQFFTAATALPLRQVRAAAPLTPRAVLR
jgi:xanthine/CO dehydrogenase XdhC/CoxF family maturation factor